MKKIACFLLLLTCYCGKALANDALTTVSGHVNRENAVSIILYQVIEGKKVEYASTRLDDNKDFAFAISSVKEGFYYLSDQRKSNYTRIYLKNGERLELELNEGGYEFVKGSKENKLLHDWFLFSAVISEPNVLWKQTYTTFFPKLEAFIQNIPQFKEKIKIKNRNFAELLNLAVDVDVENAAIYFLLIPNSVHPTKDQYPSFYNSIIQSNKYKSARLLELGEGVDMINRYTTFNYLMNSKMEKPSNLLYHNAELFGNDTIKGAYIANALRYKSYEALEKDIDPVRKYLVTDSMKAAYFRAMKAVAEYKKGSPAFNFAYEDISGKKVSMTDLKGKVVLIDVWATWCGPCKVEIPHLKQLEDEFKGKNVEFVSVSVDVLKDKEKWKSFVAEKELGGTQLFAAGWSDITKYYDITGIPRFMVFDQEGKIVTADAPRPSTPELKKLLQETLNGR